MELPQALEILNAEIARGGLRAVAKRLGYPHNTVDGWRKNSAPKGERLRALLEWAESQPAPAPLPSVLRVAQERTDANLTRLAEIQGYARAVWHMMQTVTDQQADVVRALEPWGVLESQAMSAEALAKVRAVEATLDAVLPRDGDAAAPPAPAARRKRRSG
jgi:hypothetical protein